MVTAPDIDWGRLTHALQVYRDAGFKEVRVPWLVSEHAIWSTFECNSTAVFKGLHPIGSGEQGFVELQLNDKLPPGKYVTLTPCFRNEVEETALKQYSFMKVELYVSQFDVLASNVNALGDIVDLCAGLFDQLSGQKTEIVRTPEGVDINLNGIEIGSYGIRTYQGFTWIYATGLAEPRFTTAMNSVTP